MPRPEKADSGRGWGARGPWDRGARGGAAEGWAPPTGATRPRPLAPPLAATEPVDPRLAALRSSSPPGSRLGSPGRSGAAPRGCPGGRGWAGRGRVPRSPDSSLWHPVPRSHAGRALTLPLGARLPGAMDTALLYSLLEANCSLALAEELLLDGWGLPPDPEGRRRRAARAARAPSPACRVRPRPRAPSAGRPRLPA